MDPELIFFVIRGLIRVGAAARDAYEQTVRDQPFKMPVLPVPAKTDGARLIEYFNQQDGLYASMTAPGGALAPYWQPGRDTYVQTPEAIAILKEAADALKRERARKAETTDWRWIRLSDEGKVGVLLEQWNPAAAPIDPWARIALALADVALDYIG